MKTIITIPLVVAACVASCAVALKVLGFRFGTIDPLAAGAITAFAATVGLLPLARTQDRDPVTIVQRALIGTVLHLLLTAILAAVVIASHATDFHGPFVFWLLGAYWVSLLILVWQLRRVMLGMTAALKVQN